MIRLRKKHFVAVVLATRLIVGSSFAGDDFFRKKVMGYWFFAVAQVCYRADSSWFCS